MEDDDRPVTLREFKAYIEGQRKFNEEFKEFMEMWRKREKEREEREKEREERAKGREERAKEREEREKEREEKANEHKNRQAERAVRVKQTWEAGEYGTMILVFLELHRGSLNPDHRLKVE